MKDDQLDPVFILCYPEDFDDHLVAWAKNELKQNPEQQAELEAFQQTIGTFRQVLDQATIATPKITLSDSNRDLILKEAQAKAKVWRAEHGASKHWLLNGPVITFLTVIAVGILFAMTNDLFRDETSIQMATNQATPSAEVSETAQQAQKEEAILKEKIRLEKIMLEKVMLAKLEETANKESDDLKKKIAPSKSPKMRPNDRNFSKKVNIDLDHDDQAQATNAFPHSQIEIAQADKRVEKAKATKATARKDMEQVARSESHPKQEYAPAPPKPTTVPVAAHQGDAVQVELEAKTVASAGSSARTRTGTGNDVGIGASENAEGIELAQATIPPRNMPSANMPKAMPQEMPQAGPMEAQSDEKSKASEESESERESDAIGGKGEDLLMTARQESKKRNFELALEKYMLWIEGHLEDVQLGNILKEAKAIARRINDAQVIQRIESIEDDLMKPDEKKENRAKKSKAVDLQLDGF
jgi:hypothetical protein